MKDIKFGVFGLIRGSTFFQSILANNASIVAVCDKRVSDLEKAKEVLGDDLATYTDFDEFLNHPGMDAVLVCNFFDQHVPYVIKILEKDIHVLCECTAASTMAEAVALVRAVEKSKATYMLAENYPFMLFNQEMKRIYETGTLGPCLFAEGEYNHPFKQHINTVAGFRPSKTHWRNFLPATYYITHSIGPLMYITGATPKRVTAMAVYAPEELTCSFVGDRAAIITCLNDDNSVFRVTGCADFGDREDSYRICGTRGQVENLRDGTKRVSLRYNHWQIPEGLHSCQNYEVECTDPQKELIMKQGHGGADFYTIREFCECLRENKTPFFDVYRSTNMSAVAILAHRSILNGNMPYDVPDFRKEEDRIKYENDTLTPFYGADGSEPTIPCSSHPDHKPTDEDLKLYYDRLEEAAAAARKQSDTSPARANYIF